MLVGLGTKPKISTYWHHYRELLTKLLSTVGLQMKPVPITVVPVLKDSEKTHHSNKKQAHLYLSKLPMATRIIMDGTVPVTPVGRL